MPSVEFQSFLSSCLLVGSITLLVHQNKRVGPVTVTRRVLWIVAALGLCAAATWIVFLDRLPWPVIQDSRKDWVPSLLRGGSRQYPAIFWGIVMASYAAAASSIFKAASSLSAQVPLKAARPNEELAGPNDAQVGGQHQRRPDSAA